MLGRLVALQGPAYPWLDDQTIRRNVAGVVVGVVDTTSTFATLALDELLRRPRQLGAARAAALAGDIDKVRDFAYEAVRFNGRSPVLARHAEHDVVLAAGTPREHRIPGGSTVILGTLSAMFDPQAFVEPDTFRVDRGVDYLHFGHGLHQCLGRLINGVEIPESPGRHPATTGPAPRQGTGRRDPLGWAVPRPVAARVRRRRRQGRSDRGVKQMIATYILPVDPAKETALEVLLKPIGDDPSGNPCLPFGRLSRLHFASLVLFPKDEGGFGPVLVFENNLDGPLPDYLDELFSYALAGLHQILGHTLGYPGDAPAERATIEEHLRLHLRPPDTFHIGNPGRTTGRIKAEARLRETLEEHLDDLVARPGGATDADSICTALRSVVTEDPVQWSWIQRLGARLSVRDRVAPWIRLVASGVLVAAVAIVLFPVTFAAIVWLRVLELRDTPWEGRPSNEHLVDLGGSEDQSSTIQNHMASMTLVKDGAFRRRLLGLVLWLVNLIARTSTGGTLGGIPGIHFAHWSQIDDGRRLLFLSNFDGSWEHYLDDFIDRQSAGLSMLWSNTKLFPRTRFLVWGGARDGHSFKAVARAYQVRTNVWYSAYPDLTVNQIDRNSTISEQILRSAPAVAEQEWLRNF